MDGDKKRVAICFSGHIRDYMKCHANITSNLIQPMYEAGYTVDIFFSTWDTIGHRSQGWGGDIGNIIKIANPTAVLIEKFDRDHFVQKYQSDQWKSRTHLSGPQTSGDSVSMWYKIYTCWALMKQHQSLYGKKYQAVFRTRPDIIYDSKFDPNWLKNLNDTTVMMAHWHGKYREVNMEMMDHFAFGRPLAMDYYMNLVKYVREYLDNPSVIHTAEGMLAHHLNKGEYDVGRIPILYSVQRANGIEVIATDKDEVLSK